MIELRRIRTEEENEAALAELDALWDADPNSPEAERRYLLSLIIEDFEKTAYGLDEHKPNPVGAILFALDRKGLRRKDLEPLLGSRSRVSEVLSRKRSLTLNQIRRLSRALGIPAGELIEPYELQTTRPKHAPRASKKRATPVRNKRAA